MKLEIMVFNWERRTEGCTRNKGGKGEDRTQEMGIIIVKYYHEEMGKWGYFNCEGRKKVRQEVEELNKV